MDETGPYATHYATSGMVCSIDHLASGAGLTMLRAGGSAADAAVAAGAVLAVVAPHMCGLGGDLFALVHDGSHRPAALNASGRAGSGADPDRLRDEGAREMPFRHDVRSVPVPGCVDGWLALHERYGRLALAEVLEPARRLAAEGFPVSPLLAAALPLVAGTPGGDELTAAPLPSAGEIRTRSGCARSLAAVAQVGREGFYGGEFGEGLLAVGAGEFTEDDLAQPLADWVEPLGLDVFGHRLWTVPPNSQGYLTLSSAWIAEGLDLPDSPQDPRWPHLLAEAARQAGHDRLDVLHEHADGAALLAPSRLAPRRDAIQIDRRGDLSVAVGAGDTTYLCATDESGLGVSLIQSNAADFGSYVAEPRTGILLHNRGIGFSLEPGHPAEYGPRRRPPSTLSPALVTTEAGELRALLGTMGGDSQPQVLLQLLVRLLHHDEAPGTAVSAGRWLLANHESAIGFATWRQPEAIGIDVEGHAPGTWLAGLRERGHRVRERGPFDLGFGHAHVLANDGGRWAGAVDPRAGNATVGAY